MNAIQHRKLASHYKRRHEQIAAQMRAGVVFQRYQVQDYSSIFRKYLDHKKASQS